MSALVLIASDAAVATGDALFPALKAVMTSLSLESDNVFADEAPPEVQGDRYIVWSLADENTAGSTALGQVSSRGRLGSIVTASVSHWSPSKRQAALMAKGTKTYFRTTAFAVTGFDVLSIEATGQPATADTTPGLTPYFQVTLFLDFQLRATS